MRLHVHPSSEPGIKETQEGKASMGWKGLSHLPEPHWTMTRCDPSSLSPSTPSPAPQGAESQGHLGLA
jgi:hypothetical protein